MKIAVITPYFYPKLGGLENYAYKICKELKNKYKCKIIVITSNHKEKKYQVENIKGIKIYRLPYMFKISNTPINPMWYFSIKKILKFEKPDIINAHTPVPFIADMAALACGNTPFLLTYHAFSLYKYNSLLFNLLISAYSQIEINLLKKATKILVVSKAIKETIPDKFKQKTVVINNSLPSKEIPKLKTINYSNRKKVNNLVFIGSLDKSHEWKGLNEILSAIKNYIATTKNDIQLNVIGEGDSKTHYKKIAKEYGISKNVNFLGKKEGKEKNEILKKSGIGILYPKSSNDAFPTVVLEYWAYSIAVLASDIVPINTIIKNQKTGYLVEAKNSEKLAFAINHVTKNTSVLNQIATNGYNELTQKYLLENEVKKFYRLAESIII